MSKIVQISSDSDGKLAALKKVLKFAYKGHSILDINVNYNNLQQRNYSVMYFKSGINSCLSKASFK